MANKIDNTVDAIETAIGAIVQEWGGTEWVEDGSKPFTALKRGVINPFKEPNVPAIGITISRLYRERETWIAELLVMLAANKGDVSCDERVTELVAQLDPKIMSVNGAGAGGIVDQPTWDFWYDARDLDSAPLAHVGAIGNVRIRASDPLKIEE